MIKRIIKQIIKQIKQFSFERTIDLNKSQWWSIEQLEEFQNQRLRRIIKHAYNNIPGYRRKFDKAKVKSADIRTKDDLWKIPITTREELQNNKDFVNEKLISGTLYTGGSTGTSLKYYESAESGKIRWNAHLRGWSWNGYIPGKKLAVVAAAQGIVREENTLNLPGDLTESNIEENLKQILDFKPQHLRGYVNSLYILAKFCLDHDIKIDFIESINTISENLYDFQRKIIERAFRGKVFEEYVCNDGGACAWECNSHEGLHYNMERAIIEEIESEMIVTDLWNNAMPFIRYRNGDAVTFLGKKCSCGRELPLIRVKGRTNDILISRKGPISPTVLMAHGVSYATEIGAVEEVKPFRSGIRAVQYVQKPGYKLQVNLVKNDWCSEREIQDFTQDILELVGDMELDVHIVDTIPASPKGKRQFIINEDKELLKKWKVNKR